MNPRRRHYRRRARRNPPMYERGRILGFSMKELAYTGVGFIAPPAIEGFVNGFLPATLTSNNIGRYAIKIGAVAAVSFAGMKFIGREAGKYLAIGGATYILANIIVDYMPTLFKGFTGYMNPGSTFMPRMARQPFLGMYTGTAGIGVTPTRIPERINPVSRF